MKNIIDKIKNFNTIEQYYINYALATQTLVGGGTIQLIKECVEQLDPADTYLEVGCYQAWNFSLASHFAKCECVAVDNFSQDFQENSRYDLPTRDLVLRNIQTIGRDNGKLIEGDFREVLQRHINPPKDLFWTQIEPQSVKIYFYDGPHEYQDQVDGVELALPLLQDEAVIFVDDWGSPNVKQSTKYLLENNKELNLIRILDGPRNRERFNQGQVVFHFRRSDED